MLSPEEIRNLDLRLSVRGYDRAQVDGLLAELRETYADVWNDRTRLHDELVELRAELTARDATEEKLIAEVARLEAAKESLEATVADLKALARVRATAGELELPRQGAEDGERPNLPRGGDEDGVPSRPLRDLPFDALKDYVMQRFEFHSRTDDAKETE